ncbi:ABC transporter ATP-binding protein [Streptomyces jumonjinensis]|uniref:ABC transporter ATP-binding protein n=1 Tax=Streptomyces jumonjinensis TaxID=1945 RepID=UPI0037BBB07D
MVDPPDSDVIEARSLHHSHSGSPALIAVSLRARRGEVLAVHGPRGSGKTTLLRCLSGQTVADEGEVWFDGDPVHTLSPLRRERLRRERFGWIGPEPSLVPELTVWENAALPLLLNGAPHRHAKAAAMEWLERLDIDGCARRRPYGLTRAERQRTAAARALVGEPAVLFADEPTAALHRADRALLLRTLLAAAGSQHTTVVLATHDTEVAALANRTLALVDGRLTGSPDGTDAEGMAACSLSV